MFLPKDDGITHVNVYSQGQTKLGRALSNFTRAPFEVPEHGKFESIEGYWYWLGCKDDRLRFAVGYAAKKLGRELKASDWNNEPDFKAYIITALKAKLDAHPWIKDALKLNSLPLAHYYVFNGFMKDESRRAEWILAVFKEYA